MSTPPAAISSPRLGRAGWLRYCVPAEFGGASGRSTRARSASSAKRSRATTGLADFAFAMQGLGSGAISLDGSAPAQAHYLPPVSGAAIAAFALSEPDAGSDVACHDTTARATATPT